MNEAQQNNIAAALVTLMQTHNPSEATAALMAAASHMFKHHAAGAATRKHFVGYARAIWVAIEKGERLASTTPTEPPPGEAEAKVDALVAAVPQLKAWLLNDSIAVDDETIEAMWALVHAVDGPDAHEDEAP